MKFPEIPHYHALQSASEAFFMRNGWSHAHIAWAARPQYPRWGWSGLGRIRIDLRLTGSPTLCIASKPQRAPQTQQATGWASHPCFSSVFTWSFTAAHPSELVVAAAAPAPTAPTKARREIFGPISWAIVISSLIDIRQSDARYLYLLLSIFVLFLFFFQWSEIEYKTHLSYILSDSMKLSSTIEDLKKTMSDSSKSNCC